MTATDRAPGTFVVLHIRMDKNLVKLVNEDLDVARAIEALVETGSGVGWLHDIAYRLPAGTRVRVTVEVLL